MALHKIYKTLQNLSSLRIKTKPITPKHTSSSTKKSTPKVKVEKTTPAKTSSSIVQNKQKVTPQGWYGQYHIHSWYDLKYLLS